MPVDATAARAAAASVPCTSTVVGVAAASEPSWWARKAWTGAGAGAAAAVAGAASNAARTAAPLTAPRVLRYDRLMTLLVEGRRCALPQRGTGRVVTGARPAP